MSTSLLSTPSFAPSYVGTDNSQDDDRRILIVDDQVPVRTIFAQALEGSYICTVAGSAREALEHLSLESYALVITDVQMPGLSGVELLREIVARYPDTAVIMASGIDRSQRVLDTLRLGASDYLIKPCDLDVLELSVERALERRNLVRSARRYKQDLERRNTELAHRKAELERLQTQIVHNEKMASIGQLAAGVAHELNNPAGFIFGNMELLRNCARDLEGLLRAFEEVKLSERDAERISRLKAEIDYQATLDDLHSIITDCHDGAERIRQIVQNLRAFCRLGEAECSHVDIHEGLDSTIRLLSRYYHPGCVTLHRNYGRLPPVDCFASQINQVWMNLLVNAAQAVAGNGGAVTITTRLDGENAVIDISDTGSGISPEHLDKIFDPFFTTKPVGEGTGLGLSISYGIVERHGGSIKVKSRPGRGTTFTVSIPVKLQSTAAAAGS